MKRIITLLYSLILVFSLTGCSNNSSTNEIRITVAAAASLKNCMDDKIIPMFQEKYPNIKIQTTYDSSGKLQAQIEEGAPIDVFMPAAMKQMAELDNKGLIAKDSIIQLLENKIVLILPEGSTKEIKTFEDILRADKIAIGDPESVPAGQYAKEILKNLNIWDKAAEKASFGTNVTEVLNWVAEASADAGIVYSTDAASNQKVKVIAEAPEGSVSKVIYPVGIIKATKEEDASKKFIEFLETDDAAKVFESYGFTVNK
ncbi:MAG: molybdate ABC transporter substrate-binding protein [Clostridiales bacterium]|jgi:molybdate transport system substrate-binding protein|nr:molybdate ABC transporter substrate-binding protein [Clostridiales bacterium]NLZ47833.1 molybdate ABC transporter substrate-binding protein [Clostridiales bacterium]